MTLFLDTEFNEFQGDLISIALVDVNGNEFYEVLECQNPKPWVKENVIPVLNKQPIPRWLLQDRLAEFLSDTVNDSGVVEIVADWPDDIRYFCELLIIGPGLKKWTPKINFLLRECDYVSAIPHNALEDAKGIMKAVWCDI